MPENIETVITLFRDPRRCEFEDKDWSFSIEVVVDIAIFTVFIISRGEYQNILSVNLKTSHLQTRKSFKMLCGYLFHFFHYLTKYSKLIWVLLGHLEQ